jgi:hypothetical protein
MSECGCALLRNEGLSGPDNALLNVNAHFRTRLRERFPAKGLRARSAVVKIPVTVAIDK